MKTISVKNIPDFQSHQEKEHSFVKLNIPNAWVERGKTQTDEYEFILLEVSGNYLIFKRLVNTAFHYGG